MDFNENTAGALEIDYIVANVASANGSALIKSQTRGQSVATDAALGVQP